MFSKLMTVLFPALAINLLVALGTAAATTSACFTGTLSAYSPLASVPAVQQYCSSHYPVPAVTSTTTVKKTTTTTIFVTNTNTITTATTFIRRLTDYEGSFTTTTVNTVYTTTVTVIVSGTSRSTHAKRAPATSTSTSHAAATASTTQATSTSTDVLASLLSKGSVIVGQVCTCVEVPKTVTTTTTVTSTASVTKTRTATETDTNYYFSTIYVATVSYTQTQTDYETTSTSTVTTTVTIEYPKTCNNPYNCPASMGTEPQICGESASSGDNACHCFQRVNGDTICSDGGGGCGETCSTDADCTGTDYQGYGYVCVTGTCCTGDDGQYTGICIPNDPNCQINNSNASKKKKRSVYNEVFGMWIDRYEL